MPRCILLLSFVGFAALTALAGAPMLHPDLTPRTVIFAEPKLPLDQAVQAIAKQTGNAIADRRARRANPTLKLPAGPLTFWPALDALGLGVSAYQPDGGVALVDAPPRKLPTCDRGLFRFTIKRIAVSRDLDTQAHQCQVTLDAAWEPRLQLLYLNLDKTDVRFGKKTEALDRQASRSVAGASAVEIELRMQAPERTVAKLDSLNGELRVLGAPKMLDFTFANPSQGNKAEQEDVKVQVLGVKRTANRWEVDLKIENPFNARAHLSSYQSWLDNNRIRLTWSKGPDLSPDPTEERVTETVRGAKIKYVFLPNEKTPLPPAGAAVTLHYRTPNRVLAFAVPFAFRDLPLP